MKSQVKKSFPFPHNIPGPAFNQPQDGEEEGFEHFPSPIQPPGSQFGGQLGQTHFTSGFSPSQKRKEKSRSRRHHPEDVRAKFSLSADAAVAYATMISNLNKMVEEGETAEDAANLAVLLAHNPHVINELENITEQFRRARKHLLRELGGGAPPTPIPFGISPYGISGGPTAMPTMRGTEPVMEEGFEDDDDETPEKTRPNMLPIVVIIALVLGLFVYFFVTASWQSKTTNEPVTETTTGQSVGANQSSVPAFNEAWIGKAITLSISGREYAAVFQNLGEYRMLEVKSGALTTRYLFDPEKPGVNLLT
ncbi:MAG TPA: hypothetical protein VEA59_05970, partial [Patescibacteria group bacterium]|nr:hypothetical protein [Patescibacteria group bacterium]